MKKIILKIDGMTCSGCSNGLEKYLNKQDGIIEASVNLVMANALIKYDETKLAIGQIETFVKQAGFQSLGLYDSKPEKKKNQKEKTMFIIFGLLAIILLYISMGSMIGLPIFDFLSMHTHPITYTIVLFLLTLAFMFYGFDILKSGYKNLIHKTPNMDTLVSIGVISSFLYSIYHMILLLKGDTGAVHHLYFESAAIILFFIKLGHYLDGISKDKTKEAIQKLVQITPNKAIIKINGVEKEVTIDEIKKGDMIITYPGGRISVDGEVIEGKAHVDESFITGESKPVTKTIGDKVIAGSINYDGYLAYRAEKIGKDSTISQIVNLVLEATNTKAPIAKIADRVSSYFVPIVFLIAILSFLGYWLLGFPLQEALTTFVTILVVACPCALGLATPLAIVVSEGTSAKRGILVKKSEVLENAAKINTVVFDKTGTLTYGHLKIAHVMNVSSMADVELLQQVSSLEMQSTHPIRKAFEKFLEEQKLSSLPVSDFENLAGLGIKGTIGTNEFILGNAKILEHFAISNSYKEKEKQIREKGNSIIYVAQNNKIIGLIGVNDVVREDAKKVVKNLKRHSIETIMLTGDNTETAHVIAKEIGIENVIAEVMPSEKADKIKKLKKEGKIVLMCGDGINDSPALANSDIGVSFNSGTDIAMDSSDVILMHSNLTRVLDLLSISKHTIRNIKQNLFWAFFYNLLMIPIAIGLFKPWGISISPMIAGFAMVISSLTVILNSLHLRSISKIL